MTDSLSVPPKVKMELPQDPAVPLLAVYPKELKMGNQMFVRESSLPHY